MIKTSFFFIFISLIFPYAFAQNVVHQIIQINNLNFVFLGQNEPIKEKFKSKLENAKKVLGQCGITIKKINYVSLDNHPDKVNYLAKNKMFSFFQNVNMNFPYNNYLSIYVLSEFLGKEFATGKSYAEWVDLDFDSIDTALKNTIWLASKTILNTEDKRNYSLLAHELIHVLTKRGSHYSPNPAHQLSTTFDRTDLILNRHCVEMRENIIMNGF